jgi:flagellar basal-body rod protein FlgG
MSFHALKTSGSSLKNIQLGINAISHNIANVNTNGYKKQQVGFAALVNSKANLGEGLSGTVMSSTKTVFSQGLLKNTGSATDLAIVGEGFFTLQTTSGEVVYSRAGHFNIDANRDIVDAAGNYLLSTGGGKISIPLEAQGIEITPEGEINVLIDPVTSLQAYDQIQLASFVNPEGLHQLGGNNYQETSSSGMASFSTAGESASQTQETALVSGTLELSNTDLSESLTDLMAYQRSYQAVSKTSSVADEVLQATINLAS